MFWKDTYTGTFTKSEFLQQKVLHQHAEGVIGKPRDKPRGVNKTKLEEIQKNLVPLMTSASAKQYWNHLPCNEMSEDLTKMRERVLCLS